MSEPASERKAIDVGSAASVKLTATPTSGSAEGATTTWELTSADENLDQKYVNPAARAKVLAKSVKGTKAGWANTITLPPVGGDTHTVRVKTAGKSGELVKEVEVSTERVIPLTLYYVDQLALTQWTSAFDLFQKAYAAVGIRFAVTPQPVKTDVEELVFKEGRDRDDFLARDLAKLFRSGALPPVEPAVGHLRVFAIRKLQLALDLGFDVMVSKMEAWDWQGGKRIRILRSDGPAKLRPSPMLSAKLTVRGQTTDVVEHFSRASDTELGLRLPDSLVNGFPGGTQDKTARLVAMYEATELGFDGWSDGKNLLVVGTRNNSGYKLEPADIAKVAIHEVGHALGQVPKQRSIYPGGKEGTTHYDKHGGDGDHCKTGATEVDDPQRRMKVMRAGTCVMYHNTLASSAQPTFCASCQLDLKAADLRVTGPRRKWWKT